MRTLTISPQSCVSLGGTAYTLCLPIRELCEGEGNGGTVVPIGQAFNCDICPPDTSYMIPYKKGDIIHLQTRYFDSYNADPQRPASGFGSFIIATITDGKTRTPITTGMVAYGCGTSFQVLEIDTSTIPLTSWTVEYEVRNADGSVRVTAQSQEYCEVSTADCENTLLIQGVGKGQDCFGNCYEEPDAFTGQEITYNNSMRFWANIKDVGGNFDKSQTSGGYFSTTTYENYRLVMRRKVPPFVKNILLKQLLAAPIVLVNGESYSIDSFSVDNQVQSGSMFFFGVDLVRECKGNGC